MRSPSMYYLVYCVQTCSNAVSVLHDQGIERPSCIDHTQFDGPLWFDDGHNYLYRTFSWEKGWSCKAS